MIFIYHNSRILYLPLHRTQVPFKEHCIYALQLSDLGSDLDASSGDSEEAESEDGSDVSWETEEEEEVDDPDADDPNNEYDCFF